MRKIYFYENENPCICDSSSLIIDCKTEMTLVLISAYCAIHYSEGKLPLFTCLSDHFVSYRICTTAPKFKKVNYRCATKKVGLSCNRKVGPSGFLAGEVLLCDFPESRKLPKNLPPSTCCIVTSG